MRDWLKHMILKFSDEEMSPRTKHKRSASTESPRCLMNDEYPSFIEPGSREVPIDVEMVDGKLWTCYLD